ncbi:hypothetical protein BDB00DRAFT_859643 [Zychaea mexicana]|uniref:uncharacterized protein n=1 Tax=Zychaea mexicana TaxID=64656 RepID=UPI0022FEE01A|nr:uncharacterized protein BDB00DRAFT_859643 [Zychaea mexicana]KAI9477062.1 hypothetical protein BDB00DRAFT_859643 [Zychaea mexicana]
MGLDGFQETQRWCTDLIQLDAQLQQLDSMKTQVVRLLFPNNQEQQFQQVQQKQQASTQWQLSIVNGLIQLDTRIETVEDFIQFTQASLRYLSPFKGLFKQDPIRFESTSISTTLGLGTVLQRNVLSKPRKKRFAMIGYDDENSNAYCGGASIPFNHRAIMDHIIPLYLEHCNILTGHVHTPTFLNHYHSLDDPTECPIVLAVCIDALVSIRHVLKYTPIQRRLMAEEFYSKFIDLLFELYEDPERKLDIVIVTSLVEAYLTDALLNYVESRRLVAVALLICAELEVEEHNMNRVERALFQRHRMYLETCNRAFDMYFENKINFTIPDRMLKLDILEDEPEKTQQFVQLYNYIFGLLGIPYISTIMGQINAIFYGKPCELMLEDILQYEPIVLDWWKDLPAELRICEDPFDPMVYTLVEKELSPLQLYPIIALHLLTGVLASSILQPQFVPSSSKNTISMNVILAVREKLMKLALNSSKVLIHSLKWNWGLDSSENPSFSLCLMTHVLYCLEKLGHCADLPFPVELLHMMKEDFNLKKKALLPADHQVPSTSSLVTSYLENTNLPTTHLLYEQYPLPGLAMLSDILISSFNQLDRRYVNITI